MNQEELKKMGERQKTLEWIFIILSYVLITIIANVIL